MQIHTTADRREGGGEMKGSKSEGSLPIVYTTIKRLCFACPSEFPPAQSAFLLSLPETSVGWVLKF
jgi:hypothetical protein